MAKKDKTAKNESESTEAVEAAPKAPRGIQLTLGDGRVVGRSAYIKELYQSGEHTRGEIVKIINDLGQGNPIPYQIVFAATKGMEGKKVERKAKPAKEAAAA